MVILTAMLQAKAGLEQELEKHLSDMVDKVAQEEGAREYRLHKSADVPGRFYFYEAYRDQQALDAHMNTPHFAALLKVLDGTLASAPVLEKFDFLKGIPSK